MPEVVRPGEGRAVVIGGGLIGLSVARRLASDGWEVTVLDRAEPGREASSAAAGMLTPHLEFPPDSPVLAAALESRALYPAFVRELEDEAGQVVDLRLQGVIVPCDATPRPESGPRGARLVNGNELRSLEPGLGEAFAAAWLCAEDGSVDPRALVSASLAAARARGVAVLPHREATEVLSEGGRVRGVRSRGEVFPADCAVNCAGAWAGQVKVDAPALRVRPIKGQMIRLDARSLGNAAPRRVLYSHHAYVVPRSDGTLIVGTTVEDKGFDKTVDAGAVARLLEGAVRLCPGLAGARFVEAWAGLRPLGDDPAPRVGAEGPAGYFVAAGHYRNGILLAPLTQRLVGDAVAAWAGKGRG